LVLKFWRQNRSSAYFLPQCASCALASERLLSLIEMRIPDSNIYQKRVALLAIGKGRRTRWRITIVMCLIWCTYTIRAFVDCFYAFGFVMARYRLTDCGVCEDCQPTDTLMFIALSYHPELPIISSLISVPAALTLSVCGVMGQQERQLLFRK
jgi:hypothetical protein